MNNPSVQIHPTAMIEDDVRLGDGTSIWDHVHIRRGASLGDQCIVGEKSYIAYDVTIGHRVKINAMVYICYGVHIEDGVMISAGTIFTNDRFPRATTPALDQLRPSEPDSPVSRTWVRRGATIGAGCVIGAGLEIGEFAMVGMGAVVTRHVGKQHLVVGNPARTIGYVCRCGPLLARTDELPVADPYNVACQECGSRYVIIDRRVQVV